MDQKEPKSPDDDNTKKLVESLAKNVAKHGKKFEKRFKERHAVKSELSFLDEGNEFYEYYQHRVNADHM